MAGVSYNVNTSKSVMAEFKFFCPRCGKQIQCDTSYCGTQINCPACQQPITVPHPPSTSVSIPAPQRQNKFSAFSIAIAAMLIVVLLAGLYLYSRSQANGLAASWSWNGNVRDGVHGSKGTMHGQVKFVGGMGERALELDGNGYLTIPGSDDLDIGKAKGMTIECWVKLNSLDGQGPVVEWSDTTVSATGDGVQLWAGGTLFANLRDTSDTPHRIESPPGILTSNVFQLVAVTYDKASGDAKLYIDGRVVATQHFGKMTPQTAYPKISIGRRISQPIGLGSNFNGLISELRIYRRALSEGEIAAIYNASKAK